jgi:hypothetical protein
MAPETPTPAVPTSAPPDQPDQPPGASPDPTTPHELDQPRTGESGRSGPDVMDPRAQQADFRQGLTKGRVVLYQLTEAEGGPKGGTFVGTIVAILDRDAGRCTLVLWDENGLPHTRYGVAYSAERAPGTWRYVRQG